MKRFRIKRRSTTIIEIAAAIVILSIALPPLINAFTEAAMQSIHPSNAAVASFLAIDRMEEVVARRYRGTQGGTTGYDAVSTANFPDEVPISGFSGFERRVTVAEVDASLSSSPTPVGYKVTKVTVSWNGGSNEIVIERVFADF